MPTLIVVGLLGVGAVMLAVVGVRAIIAGPWLVSIGYVLLVGGGAALLMAFALFLSVPLQVAVLRWRLRLQEIAKAQSSRTRAVPLRSQGVVVGISMRALWVEDRGPRGTLDRAGAARFRPVAARWKADVRMPKGFGIDMWFWAIGFGLVVLGILLLTIARSVGAL